MAPVLLYDLESRCIHHKRVLMREGCVFKLNCCFIFLQRGRTALAIAMQGSHTDTASLLQAHAKVRAL